MHGGDLSPMPGDPDEANQSFLARCDQRLKGPAGPECLLPFVLVH